jgi:ERCC4-related helicase
LPELLYLSLIAIFLAASVLRGEAKGEVYLMPPEHPIVIQRDSKFKI